MRGFGGAGGTLETDTTFSIEVISFAEVGYLSTHGLLDLLTSSFITSVYSFENISMLAPLGIPSFCDSIAMLCLEHVGSTFTTIWYLADLKPF